MACRTDALLTAVRAAIPGAGRTVCISRVPASPRAEVLRLHQPDGREQACVWKRADPWELALYRTALAPDATGAPALLGAVERAPAGRCWLFLERLPEQFADMTDGDTVEAVYRHLGALHRRMAGRAWPPGIPAPTGLWPTTPTAIRQSLSAFPRLAPHAAAVASALTGGPVTLIHGDYHRWNLLSVQGAVRVLDWERAAVTHPIWDLALLAPEEPGWEGVPRGALAERALRAYHEGGLLTHLPWPEFRRLHQMARLVIATRNALQHRTRLTAAARLPVPDAAAVIAESLRQEMRRIDRLSTALFGRQAR